MRSVSHPVTCVPNGTYLQARSNRLRRVLTLVVVCIGLSGMTSLWSTSVASAATSSSSPIGAASITPPEPPTGNVELPRSIPHRAAPGSPTQTVRPDLEAAVCTPITVMFNGSPYVYEDMDTLCSGYMYQQIEVCLQQYYEGSWHSSNSCRANPTNTTAYSDGLSENSGGIYCTSGRPFRAWGWFYTPYALPIVTEEFYPDGGGEARC